MSRKLASILGLLALTVAMLLLTPTVKADSIIATLTPSTLSTGPGTTVHFTGTIAPGPGNGAPIFLNGDSLGAVPAGLTGDDTPFFTDFVFGHFEIDPGDAPFAGGFFDIFVSLNQPVGAYSGTFDILGGPGLAYMNVLATVNYTVNVTPEPSSILVLGTGLTGLAGVVRRKLRKS